MLLLFPLEHILIVGEAIVKLLLISVLQRLLLEFNVPETTFLLLLFLTLILLEGLLIGCSLTIDEVLVTDKLATQFALVVGHLSAEFHLLRCVLLLKLLPQGGLLVLMGVLNLQVDLT